MDGVTRPKSALAIDFAAAKAATLPGAIPLHDVEDVTMTDAGPSTAPLQGGNSTFFQD